MNKLKRFTAGDYNGNTWVVYAATIEQAKIKAKGMSNANVVYIKS